jgi:hypothetical protein
MPKDLVLTLAAAFVAGLVTYITVRRTSKGTIRTSEASDLWAASNSLREWLTKSLDELRDDYSKLEERLAIQEENSKACEERERALKDQLRLLGGTVND